MKRVIDLPYYSFTVYSAAKTGICVKCPLCGGEGMVRVDDKAYFKCFDCGSVKEKSLSHYRTSVHAHCKNCGKYFRREIEAYGNCGAAHVTCPECGAVMSGKIERVPIQNGAYYSAEIHNACEPFFGCELRYSGSFDGKSVWALNREHLDYLIEYLSADLREKRGIVKKTQSDHLPKFMKIAKNREGVVKVLIQMREKR